MSIFYTIRPLRVLFMIVYCALSTISYAKPDDSIKNLESQVELLKKENTQLHHDIDQLEKTQYQNIRQYHDDLSSEVSTYMTWVGIMAAILAMVVTAVSIVIPLMSNRRFEKRIDGLFKSFRGEQEKYFTQNKKEQKDWNETLENKYQKKFEDLLSKMKGIKKDVVSIQEQTRQSERKAWISQILSEANREINEGHYDAAVRLCSQVIGKDSSNDSAYNTRGIAYAQKELFDEAIKDFDIAIQLRPQDKNYFANRALANLNQKKYDKAISDYSNAIQLDDSDDSLFNNRGFAYLNIKEYNNAIFDYDSAIQLNQGEASYFVNRGLAKFNLQKYNEAIKDYSTGIELKSTEPLFFYNRAIARIQIRNYNEAIVDLNEAIKLNDTNYAFFLIRGVSRFEIKDYEGAISDYDMAESLDNTDFNIFYNRGNVKFELGDYEGAIVDYDNAILIDKTKYQIYYNRGNAKYKLHKYQDAINDYGEAIKLNSTDYEIYRSRGNVKNIINDYEGAICDYDRAIMLNAENPDLFFNRGIIKYNMGDYVGTIDDCDKAISMNGDEADYYMVKGQSNYMLGKYSDAIINYEVGMTKGRSKSEAYNEIAQCYMGLQNYQRAMEVITQAIELSDQNDGIIIDTRGEIHMSQNNLDAALSDFNQAIQLIADRYELFEHRALCYRKMAELENDENIRMELISNAEADESEVERLKGGGDGSETPKEKA